LNKNAIFPYPDDLDCEKFAACGVNPITVLNMAYYAKKYNHKAIIHSAACSSLGKMLVRYTNKIGLTLINVVRREEQVKILKELGAEHVLDSTSETFETDLKELSHQHEATGFFDAVAGDLTSQVLKNMPAGSTAYIYGGLSLKPYYFSPLDAIFYKKTISWLWLSAWLGELSEEERKEQIGIVIQDLSTGGEIFGSNIAKTFPLSKFGEAIEAANKHASEGKVLLKPHES
jgi:NADPH:quinone reductase